MAIVRAADLMAAAVAILKAGGGVTDAGENIWAPRDWPSTPPGYPCIFVSIPHEFKESAVGRGLPAEYFATATLRLSMRVSELAAADDATAGADQHALDALQAQVEVNIINNPALWDLELQQFVSIESQSVFDASTGRQLGQRVLDIKLEYHAEPESFWQPTAVPLTRVTVDQVEPVDTVNPGLDITLAGG